MSRVLRGATEPIELFVEGLTTTGIEVYGANRHECAVVGQNPAGSSEGRLSRGHKTTLVGVVLAAKATVETYGREEVIDELAGPGRPLDGRADNGLHA